LLIWVVYLPFARAIAFSGDVEHYYALGGETRGIGTHYGMHTTWIWCILALLKWPTARREKIAEPGAPPNPAQRFPFDAC
jgi:hypothetical protein